jgi:hypothetical protein
MGSALDDAKRISSDVQDADALPVTDGDASAGSCCHQN